MTVTRIMEELKSEKIDTWFDLGLFIDRFRENRKTPNAEFMGFYDDFRESIETGGIGIITYDFGIDGVTMEICKYAKTLRGIFHNVPIHFIGGKFYSEGKHLIEPDYNKYEMKEITSFNTWPLYNDFFITKLHRGSSKYNELIHKYWEEVLSITEKLGTYIEKNRINLLYLVNICSNPGNVALALGITFISEYFGIPVINNSHDFYWEGGNKQVDIKGKNLKPGPRDFFFTNSDVGEFFSIIEMLYPWESRSWLSININKNQSRHIVDINGHNPANVFEINTAVDIKAYQNVTKEATVKAFMQIKDILSRYEKKIIVHYTKDIIDEELITKEIVKPMLLGYEKQEDFDFIHNNIILLQPTRVMFRKRIEIGFDLIKKLFENKEFSSKIQQNPLLRITLLVTGPIAKGQVSYLKKLVRSFSSLLKSLNVEFRDRVYLGFLFSEFDKKTFIEKYKKPLTMLEVYNIASLIMLPSETEGRGLPIIEAAACGIPIFVSRFYPERVYDEVMGRHLEPKKQFKVLEFNKNKISEKLVKKILEWIFFPQKFIHDIKHNQAVVQNRFSMESLKRNMENIIFRLYSQLKPNQFSLQRINHTISEYKKLISYKNKDLQAIVNTKSRYYMPGFGQLTFMLFLKSLIDPSYFRIEEQRFRGMAMKFAMKLVNDSKIDFKNNWNKLHRFFNGIDNIFLCTDGEVEIRHDHSLSYRHRNKKYYPYQSFTFQELTGFLKIVLIYRAVGC